MCSLIRFLLASEHESHLRLNRPHRLRGRDSVTQQRSFKSRCSPNVGVTQVGDRIWLVTFMQYDLGYFDDETCRLEPIENPFGPKVLPMCPE
jgi:hypothetical protein